jgi:hypothetical protein
MEDLGVVCVLPILLVFTLAVVSRRPIESLATGALVGLAILHGSGFITGFAETSLRVLTDQAIAAGQV